MPPKRHIDLPTIEKYYRIDEDGAIFSYRKNKYLKPIFNTAGYLFVAIVTDDDPYRMIAVHRLVATKYVGECPPELETSHKDGNKMNNHYTNLEYLTHAKNILKSYQEHGRQPAYLSYPRKPFSDATKELMSNAKKKRVRHTVDGVEVIYDSIADTAQSLNTYIKLIYISIYKHKELKSLHNPDLRGFLSFVDTPV